MRPLRRLRGAGSARLSARVSGVTASLADETVPQAGGNVVEIAAAATEALAVAALCVGFGLMTIAAASDTVFALIDGGGLLAGIEGVVLTALAVCEPAAPGDSGTTVAPTWPGGDRGSAVRPRRSIRLGHPEPLLRGGPGNRVDRCDRLLATVDRGLRSGLRSRLSRRPSAEGPFPRVDADPDRTGTRGQPVGRPRRERWRRARAGRALAPVHRRCVLSLAAARAGGPAITPALAAAVRAEPVALLPSADAASLIAPLTDAEQKVLALLRDGRCPSRPHLNCP